MPGQKNVKGNTMSVTLEGKSIKMMLEQALINERAERSKRERSGKWSPSSLGQCMRRQYWNRLGEPESNPPDSRALSIFKVGNLFEDFIFSILPKEIERQVKVQSEFIFGYADGVTEDEVIEIKTQHSRKFWHVNKEKKTNEEWTIAEHNPEHILQAGTYAVLLGKSYIRMIYVSKDDMCIDEYRVKVTPELRDKITTEVANLETYWVKKQLPPAVPRLYPDKKYGGFKECTYCSWHDKCFKMEGKRYDR